MVNRILNSFAFWGISIASVFMLLIYRATGNG